MIARNVSIACRSFFTRTPLQWTPIPQRKILDKYDRVQLDRVKVKTYMEKQREKKYKRDLARAIVEQTEAFQEWEYETDKAKKDIYKKYLGLMDETHPFLVDDYRMEVAKELRRIDFFYKPLIEKEADILKAKRDRGLIHIEPEPFHLLGLDEVIPEINRLLSQRDDKGEEDSKQLPSNKHTNTRKLLN